MRLDHLVDRQAYDPLSSIGIGTVEVGRLSTDEEPADLADHEAMDGVVLGYPSIEDDAVAGPTISVLERIPAVRPGLSLDLVGEGPSCEAPDLIIFVDDKGVVSSPDLPVENARPFAESNIRIGGLAHGEAGSLAERRVAIGELNETKVATLDSRRISARV